MKLLRNSLLLVALILPGLAWAQEVPIPPRLSGHFEVATGKQSLKGEKVDIYLKDGLTYTVRIGKRWFEVKRAKIEDAVFKGGEVGAASVTDSGAPSGNNNGAADALDNLGNGNTPGSGNNGGSAGTSDAASGETLELEVVDVRNYKGSLKKGSTTSRFTLTRRVMIPPAEPEKFDRGPRGGIAYHMRNAPAYPNTGDFERVFWDEWGSVFYRGRTNTKARLIGIASDPGPTEGLPFIRRSLVGDAGQRTQGFLEKLGLTESYVLVNAFTYPTRPSRIKIGRKLFDEVPEQLEWRNRFYDLLFERAAKLEAIVLFGGQAEKAFDMWNKTRIARGLGDVRTQVAVVQCAHPSSGRGDWDSYANTNLARGWNKAVKELRAVVTPDDKELAQQPNFGSVFSEVDYAEIPPADLPKASQKYPWVRDNSWSRTKVSGRRNNSVRRYGRLNMEFNDMEGGSVWIRITGRDANNPNRTPRYKVFKDIPSIAEYALKDVFGKDTPFVARLADSSKTRKLNLLKLLDSSKTGAELEAAVDDLLPKPKP